MTRRFVNHYAFAISTEAAERQLIGYLDMCRYEQCRVVEADASLIILRSINPPTEGRWRSFGIPVLAVDAFREDDLAPTSWLREQALPKLPAPRTRRRWSIEHARARGAATG